MSKTEQVASYTGLNEDQTRRFVGCLLAVGLQIVETKDYAALQSSHEELVKALDAMINERYSELDMMCCEYPRGSTEAIAWEAGVRQAWKLWDLSKQLGRTH